MSMFKILIAEDDHHLRTLLTHHLTHANFEVLEAKDGLEAKILLNSQHIDCVIADIMMPKLDGNQLLYYIRSNHEDKPVIMLTALDGYDDKAKSFEGGADDYMTKPIDFKELILRVRANLRRYKIMHENEIVLPHTKIDYSTQSVWMNDKRIELPKKEFLLLFKLLSQPNQIFTREQLMNEIWGYDSESYDRTVDTHIKRIRERLHSEDFSIITVRGLGYKAVLS